MGYRYNIFVANNRIGLLGQQILLKALEKTRRPCGRGAAIEHALLLILNAPFFPPFLTRALARGMRMYMENGRLL